MTIEREQLDTLDFSDLSTGEPLRAIHPGEILREEFLIPLELSAHALSLALQVPAPRINDIVRERRSITADTAVRLARFFGTSDNFWGNLQVSYDTECAKASLAAVLGSIVPLERKMIHV